MCRKSQPHEMEGRDILSTGSSHPKAGAKIGVSKNRKSDTQPHCGLVSQDRYGEDEGQIEQGLVD